MKKQDFLIIIIGLIVLGLIVLASFLVSFDSENLPEEVKVITNAQDYKPGESLKLKIENNLKNRICFSSCYPYYLEKRNGDWTCYDYVDCFKKNIAIDCVNPKEVKAFEFVIPFIKSGIHRLALSACIGCNSNEQFQEDKKFYSNDFEVK